MTRRNKGFLFVTLFLTISASIRVTPSSKLFAVLFQLYLPYTVCLFVMRLSKFHFIFNEGKPTWLFHVLFSKLSLLVDVLVKYLMRQHAFSNPQCTGPSANCWHTFHILYPLRSIKTTWHSLLGYFQCLFSQSAQGTIIRFRIRFSF